MELYIYALFFIPFGGFLLTLLIPGRKETLISYTAFGTVLMNMMALIAFVVGWVIRSFEPVQGMLWVVLESPTYLFSIDFLFDRVSAVYLLVGTILTLMVVMYSRYYMHREEGYKRFFSTLLFFYSGYTITVLSGNFETLFVGWEMLGISSFLLIAFYRNRYLPIKNGLKVFSIYRIGDIGILLAMWMSHHLWHENITFIKMYNAELVSEHLQNHSIVGVFISLMLLMSASAKSAQFPFSSWLPRAMEGPTPSSAIFYGSLSVHIGAFLLLRTYNFFEHQYSVRIIIALLGLVTAVICALIARVQSSVKSQIAYSSAAQIGIIFIEIAAGFELVALIHFAGNAFLRTYQLLISPSLVSYLIREQFYRYQPKPKVLLSAWRRRWQATLYLLSVQEFYLDWFMYKYVWGVFKKMGKRGSLLGTKAIIILYTTIMIAGSYLLYHQSYIPELLKQYASVILAFAGLMLVFRSFVERKSAIVAWCLILLNHGFVVLAISFNETFDVADSLLYISGVLVAGLLGWGCLFFIKKKYHHIDLSNFYGYATAHNTLGNLFLLACLGMAGFPITPTFIGEDLIYTHIHYDQMLLAGCISLGFVLNGITLIRLYARVFLGNYIGNKEIESPYRSS